MTDIAQNWNIITGFVLPPIVALVLQAHWSARAKAVVAAALMLVVAMGQAYVQGAFASGKVVEVVFYVLATAVTSFKAIWQPTGIAQAIESATTVPPMEK